MSEEKHINQIQQIQSKGRSKTLKYLLGVGDNELLSAVILVAAAIVSYVQYSGNVPLSVPEPSAAGVDGWRWSDQGDRRQASAGSRR